MKKRIFSIFLALAMALSLLPTAALAAESTPVTDEAELTAALQAGGTVTLGNSIEVATTIEIPTNVTATLDLNGCAITSGYQEGFGVDSDTPKHICPLSVYGALNILDSKTNGSISGCGIYVQNNSVLTIDGGSIYGIDNNGGSAILQYGGDTTINGGLIEQTAEKTYNYAIKAESGKITINGGKIIGKHGALAVTGAVASVTDGTLICSGNQGWTDNVVYVSAGSLNVSGGTFTHTGNTVKADSGAALLATSAAENITISGGSFTGLNGALSSSAADTVVTGGAFLNGAYSQEKYDDVSAHVPSGYVYDPQTGTVAVDDGKTYVAQIGVARYETLQAAINAARNNNVITLITDCAGDVTVAQAEGIKITIDGANHNFTGTITVDGKSQSYETAGLTIQNVKFDATSISKAACINLGGENASRYISNLTVQNCTFTGANREKVAIKSYTGGDKNLSIIGCEVDNTMHSLLQVTNVAGINIDDCKVYSKNGINLNSSSNVEIKNSKVEVSGYAVRIGAGNGGESGKVTLTGNTLKTNNVDGTDAVVILRGAASTQVDLNMAENMVSGTPHISGTTAETKIFADANYWDGKATPQVAEGSTSVAVQSYYQDSGLKELKYAEGVVATVGTTGYKTLQDAVNAASSGDTISLLKDITDLSKLSSTTSGSNISLLNIDKSITINGNGKTISITMPTTATTRSQAISIGSDKTVTLNGVKLSITGSTNHEDKGDAVDVYGVLNITNNSELTINNVNNGFVMQGGENAKVNVTGGSKVTLNDVDGNATNGGFLAVKENSTVDVHNCGANGLSVYSLSVDNSVLNISDTGRAAIYGNELKFNEGAKVTVERAGKNLPVEGYGGVQFTSPVQIKDKPNTSMEVAAGATVTVQNCANNQGKPNDTIYLPNNATYTNDGNVNAEIVTAEAPENAFVVTLVNDGQTVSVQTVAKDAEFTLPKAPEKNNYTFKGWSDGSETYKAGATVSIVKDTTFTAQWSYNEGSSSGGSSSGSSSSDGRYTVKVDSGKHGDVTVSPKRADKGDTITIIVNPDNGYELDELTVTDKNGDEIKLTKKAGGKFTFKMPGSKVTVEATFRAAEETPEKPEVVNPFVDVNENAYYHDAVLWAVAEGITGGTSGTAFSPDVACTRAQAVTFLWRAAGSPVVNYAMRFSDVPADAYYAEAVRWAVSQGITTGATEATFAPDAPCTRAQIVTFIYRNVKAQGGGFTGSWMFSCPFTDVLADAYYFESVQWCVMKGITAGATATTFAPDATCTRAQIVTFLYRGAEK